MPWNVERRISEILVNRENIEDAFTYLNETKHRVKKLEILTEGVNSMNKNYNYDDSIKRLYDITNNYARRLDRIEERLDGSLADYSARGNRRNRVARRTGRRRRGGRRTRRRRRKKRTRKRRKSRRKSRRKKRRRKKRTKRRR